MTKSSESQLVAIMFSDLRGSSKIENDTQVELLYRILEDIVSQALKDPSHFYQKNLGDGYFICSYSPARLAEAALSIRDAVRDMNWQELGFAQNLEIRIGLHIYEARILYDAKGKIQDVVGAGVVKTARIEPVTDPGAVFCSAAYYLCLEGNKTINIEGKSLGVRRLAKEFGEIELYELSYPLTTGAKPPIAGRYEIGEQISFGPVPVFKGTDRRTKKNIAIKYLDLVTVSGNLEHAQRFKQEVDTLRSLQGLNHPNIVKFDIITESNQTYIVMDYCPISLDEMQKERRLFPLEVIDIGIALADALHLAHQKGIIHRDIKPSNVLLDAERNPKLTDFGIAYLAGRTRLTQYGAVGTVPYIAPEMIKLPRWMWGKLPEPDKKTDIWSFGVTLYELLTGQLPFGGDEDTQVRRAIVWKEPPPIKELNPEIPDDLALLVHRMLNKNPHRRIGNFGEIQNELKRIKEGRPRKPTWGTMSPTARKRWLIAGIFVPVIVALIGILPKLSEIALARIDAQNTQVAIQQNTVLFGTASKVADSQTPRATNTFTDTAVPIWTPSVTIAPSQTFVATPNSNATAFSATATSLALAMIYEAQTKTAMQTSTLTHTPTVPTDTPTSEPTTVSNPPTVVLTPAPWGRSFKSLAVFNSQVIIETMIVGKCYPSENASVQCTDKPFEIGVAPIRNRDYRACYNALACAPPGDFDKFTLARDNFPVVGVNFDMALKFCEVVGGHLPTEPEWEYAALGIMGMGSAVAEWVDADFERNNATDKVVRGDGISHEIRRRFFRSASDDEIGFRCVFPLSS